MSDMDEVVTDFLWRHCMRDHVEIEARLGAFRDSNGRHLSYNIQTEAIARGKLGGFSFRPDIGKDDFIFLNEKLNKAFGTHQSASNIDLKFEKISEQDFFYNANGKKIRMTKCLLEVTKPVVFIQKIKIVNMEIVTPSPYYDTRITVSEERPVDSLPEGSKLEFGRKKQRMRYDFGDLRIDLTSVESNVHGAKVISYEVELEVNTERLRSLRENNQNKEFTEFVKMVLNNIRSFQRICSDLQGKKRGRKQENIESGLQNPKKKRPGDHGRAKPPDWLFRLDIDGPQYRPSILPPSWKGFT